jgi:hypothetical protein
LRYLSTLFAVVALGFLCAAAKAELPPAESRSVSVEFNEKNKMIVVGQGANLTFRVLVGAEYGQTRDLNNAVVAPSDVLSPVTLPKDSSHRAILYYDQSGETNIAEPDIVVFEVENAQGEVSGGVIQFDVNLHPKIEFFAEDPEINPSATVLGTSFSSDEDQSVPINTNLIPDDSNSPSDFRTIWARYSDATGRTTYTSGQYLIDNTPPVLTWSKVPAHNALVSGDVEFEVSATDNIGIQQIRFRKPGDSVDTILSSPLSGDVWGVIYDSTQLPDASRTFKFEGVDVVNLVSNPALQRQLRIDNTPPATPTVSLIDNSELASLTKVTINKDEGTVDILVDNSPRSYTFKAPDEYTLVPPLTDVGPHTVTVRITDIAGNITDKTTHIVITGNRVPTAGTDIVNITRNQTVNIDVLQNDSDIDGDALVLQSVGAAAHGTTSMNPNKTVKYIPLNNFVGNDTFSYVISDGKVTASGTVLVGVSAGDNAAPTVVSDSATTPEDQSKTINVLNNDSDVDGDSLVVQSVGLPSHGTASVNPDSTVQYIPTADYYGADSFTYAVSDGHGHVVVGMVNVSVTPVDDTPRTAIDAPHMGDKDISGLFTIPIIPTDDGTISSVVIIIDGGSPANAIPTGDGGYEAILDTTPLSDGSHTVTIITTDNTGNTKTDIIPIDVDNTPIANVATPRNGSDVKGTVVIDTDPTGDTTLTEVKIYVNDELITTMTGEPFDFPWSTTTMPEGPVDLVIVAKDDHGNESTVSKIVNINNTPDSGTDPVINIIGGNTADRVGGGDITFTIVDTGLTDITFVIDGDPTPGTHISGTDHTDIIVHTPDFPDGSHTIYATYTKDGVLHTTPIIDYTIDNARPTATVVKPVLDAVVYGPVTVQADVRDAGNNPIDHVDFFVGNLTTKVALAPGHANPSDRLYDFVLDSTKYTDGLMNIFAVPYDKAGNVGTPAVFRFTINNTNPPAAGRITPHPATASFVTSAEDAKIYARFEGEALSTEFVAANASSIFSVYVEKDGESQKLNGSASLEDGKLVFSESIPDNAKISWSISVRDINNKKYEGAYTFTRMMSRALGGTVTTKDRRFKLQVPPEALPHDMLVSIVDEQTTQGAPLNFETANPGQSIIAGPFFVRGINKDTMFVQGVGKAVMCSYSVPPAQDDFNSPKVFQLAELQDSGKVFPLGSASGPRLSAVEGEPVGSRTIDVPISRFGRFVITSQILPEPGISHFYNFPNPFNPNQGGTDFHYFLGADSTVKIVILDLFGQEVRNFEIPMGTTGGKVGLNLFTWDGRNGAGESLANGGYIARVLAEDAQGRHSKATYKIGVLK